MISYFIQIALLQAIFYIIYLLVLKKTTFFNNNRIYLIVTQLVAILLPLISLSILPANQEDITLDLSPDAMKYYAISNTNNTWDIQEWFLENYMILIYAIGVLISLVALISKCISISKLKAVSKQKIDNNIILIKTKESSGFTFLNRIYINDNASLLKQEKVVEHELIHIRQRHHWDLIFYELLRVVFWFNPLLILCQRDLKLIHEYLVDRKLALHNTHSYARQLIENALECSHFSFSNSYFKQSTLKNRIVMLHKKKSNRLQLMKIALVLPVFACTLWYNATAQTAPQKPVVKKPTVEEPVQPQKPVEKKVEQTTPQEIESMSADQIAIEIKAFQAKFSSLTEQERDDYVKQKPYLEGVRKSLSKSEKESEDALPYGLSGENIISPKPKDCDATESKEIQMCMATFITNHFVNNVNSKMISEKIAPSKKFFIMFTFDKLGNITKIKTSNKTEGVNEEVTRTLSSLPQVIPGMKDGKPVSFIYQLPIQLSN